MTSHSDLSDVVVGILGGTGPQGRGLAFRLARSGQPVLIGSRAVTRARAAAELAAGARGVDNATCARESDVVVAAVPWAGHWSLLDSVREELAGRVLVDCVNPIGFDRHGAFALSVPEGSACEQAQALLPETTVVGAFHHVSAVLLLDPSVESLDTDVLVVGDERDATDLVQGLAGTIPGMRGIYAGRLRDAHQVEAMTANLIAVNRRYKAHAGLRVTDV